MAISEPSDARTGGDAARPSSNVSGATLVSPFRYPGGKTRLVPQVLGWVAGMPRRPGLFVEPFAGGGIVALNVALAGAADRVSMAELDEGVASVWSVLLGPDGDAFSRLVSEIEGFVVTREAVVERLSAEGADVAGRAFATVLRNRMNRGGIMARRASLLKAGEDNKGLMSRWYPATLVRRMHLIRSMRDRIDFHAGDGFDLIARHRDDPDAVFFVDPPYTAGGGKVGARLYTHSVIDHRRLFEQAARMPGRVVMTYDDVPEVRELAAESGLSVGTTRIWTSHHKFMEEVAIGCGDVWGEPAAAPSLPGAAVALIAA